MIGGSYAIHMEHLAGPTLQDRWPSLSASERAAFVELLQPIYRQIGLVPLPTAPWQIGEQGRHPFAARRRLMRAPPRLDPRWPLFRPSL